MSKTYKPGKEVNKFSGKNKRKFRREKIREKEYNQDVYSTLFNTLKTYDQETIS